MEDLPEALGTEIIKKITRTSDLNSLSLVSKQLYTIEGNQRGAIRVGSGLCTATKALTSLCAGFPNLRKLEIDYSGWIPGHENQLDNKGILVFSSHNSLLTDLTLSFCTYIDDSGLGCLAYCKKLVSLRLNSTPQITSVGLFSVAVGCTSLSALHLIDCGEIDNVEWLEYLGRNGSLEELVVKNCKGINHHDLLKFGSGWMKLQKFEFERKRGRDNFFSGEFYDPSYDAHSTDIYDFYCESLKDLRLAHIKTWPEIGLRVVLGKCKALENLTIEYVDALNDNDMIALSRSCSNLKSISLWLSLQCFYDDARTSFTDISLYSVALNCPMLQVVDLRFTGCSPDWLSETGFTQKGFLVLIQSCQSYESCPIRVLVLNTANFLNDDGMKALSSSPHLETLELILCHALTDAGMRFIAHTPCLSNLTLRVCHHVTDVGVAELKRAHKLESLVIEYCGEISLQAAQGVAKSVHYSKDWSPALMRKLGLGGGC